MCAGETEILQDEFQGVFFFSHFQCLFVLHCQFTTIAKDSRHTSLELIADKTTIAKKLPVHVLAEI